MRDEIRRAGSRGLVACAGATLLASCRQAGVLDPQGPISAAERLILLNATGIMLVVVAPVILMTLAFAWWYRASNRRATYRPNFEYSGQIELVVWAIPAMVVLLLAGVTWISSHELDPRAPLKSAVQPLRIEVVSLDWKWLFIYPDQQVATVNDLVVPAGTPLEFMLTSASVMNAFFVPQLGTQIYTMPGMTTHVNLLADSPGDYPGLSSHFSGDGFSDMRFVVHAVHATDFAAWVDRTRAAAPALDLTAYEQLEQPSSHLPAKTYGSVEPMLFDHILQLAAPMGAPMQH
jgi:cytochrome o ubiquinol oxidase subunit II